MGTPLDPLAIRRKSATPVSEPDIRAGAVPQVAKLVDISLCIGCKACEVACKEWNDLGVDDTHNFGSYQSHRSLTPNTWDLMLFNEVEIDGALQWLIRKDSCLHCEEPGCLLACPAPGAIVQYANGIVDFDQDQCIGCQNCLAGCPFDIPKYEPASNTVYKCTLCVDRVGAGLEPACVKACPTAAIKFGTKEDLLTEAGASVSRLKSRGYEHAAVYDPAGVGGTHMMYVLPHGDHVKDYSLPENPAPRRGGLALLGATKWAGAGAPLGRGCRLVPALLQPPRPTDRSAQSQGARARTGRVMTMAAEAATQARPRSVVQRFNLFEIVVHWLTFAAFFYLLGTGLAFAYPRLFWLTNLFGGAQTSRILHPYAGLIFTAGLVVMTLLWVRDMLPEAGDGDWWRHLDDYVTLNSEALEADTGRFNAGQKGFFWIMAVATIALLVTGLFLWQTGWSGPAVRTWMRLIHDFAMLLAFGMLLIHAYMGAAMYPGTLGSMLHGQVTRGWALLHAPRWYRQRYGRQE